MKDQELGYFEPSDPRITMRRSGPRSGAGRIRDRSRAAAHAHFRNTVELMRATRVRLRSSWQKLEEPDMTATATGWSAFICFVLARGVRNG